MHTHVGYMVVKKVLLLCCVENVVPIGQFVRKLSSISHFDNVGCDSPILDCFAMVLPATGTLNWVLGHVILKGQFLASNAVVLAIICGNLLIIPVAGSIHMLLFVFPIIDVAWSGWDFWQ